MLIQNMFQDDINRKINGVIKVNQDDQDVIEQEVREYVITRELKKHFMAFFNYYCEMFDDRNADIGVWISGFFGSGKSHFIKMVSYILENRLIGDKTVVEMFRAKFADDPATFMLIDRATRVKAEPILFNIDIESSIDKDKKAVLRVFAKMFYNHLGFFGESLRVAQMEYYIDQVGKTEEFRRVFEEKRGMPWVQARKAFAFNRKYVVAALTQVLDMNAQDADAWCRDKDAAMTRIEATTKPKPPMSPVKPAGSGDTPSKPPVKKVYKQLNRQVLFPPKTLEKPEDIDAYLAQVKATLTTMMQGCDGIRLN